ncbi:MAG: HAMP domain-containing histidine kinase [Actinobacteria bacterium]|nr:HAMP domain-containing histidine kinase [Actinomycetota bacterium]
MRWPRAGGLRRRSLRTRFGMWVAALVVMALSLFGAYVYIAVGLGLRSGLDDSLRVSASLVASTVTVARGGLVLGESMPENNSELGALLAQGNTVRYVDAQGAVMGGFGLLWNAPPDAAGLALARSGSPAFTNAADPAADKDYRVYTLPLAEGNTVAGFVQVMHGLDSVNAALQRLLAALLIGGAFVMVGVGLAGYYLAGPALAPIDEITRTAQRISAEDLSARLHMTGADDEVGRLASTFDDMLERLDDSFERERRFAADASHELRTPLAAMEAILGVVRSEARDPAEYTQALDDLAEETARLRALVGDLLQFARGARTVEAELAPVDLSTLVHDVVDVLRRLAEAKGLSLECRVDAGLTVMGDSDGLVRVFLNLLDNAIKFTAHGGIVLAAHQDGGTVHVEVTDTGIGIAPDRLPHIFEPFFRADPSRLAPGTGLGLALAQQIIHNHGGTLTVRSVQGQGTTLTVSLDAAPALRH